MSYFSSDVATVYLDEAVPCVCLIWHSFASGNQYREATLKATELMESSGCLFWLSDARALHVMTEEDEAWLKTTWLPRAAKRKRTAIVTRERGLLHNTTVLWWQETLMSQNSQTAAFATVEEAKVWLSLSAQAMLSAASNGM